MSSDEERVCQNYYFESTKNVSTSGVQLTEDKICIEHKNNTDITGRGIGISQFNKILVVGIRQTGLLQRNTLKIRDLTLMTSCKGKN
jgi:hypothetical protein